jgi:hypothetical protein
MCQLTKILGASIFWSSQGISRPLWGQLYLHHITIKDTAENHCIILHAQNATALQPNVILTDIHKLLVTSTERLLPRSAVNCTVTICTIMLYPYFSTRQRTGTIIGIDLSTRNVMTIQFSYFDGSITN